MAKPWFERPTQSRPSPWPPLSFHSRTLSSLRYGFGLSRKPLTRGRTPMVPRVLVSLCLSARHVVPASSPEDFFRRPHVMSRSGCDPEDDTSRLSTAPGVARHRKVAGPMGHGSPHLLFDIGESSHGCPFSVVASCRDRAPGPLRSFIKRPPCLLAARDGARSGQDRRGSRNGRCRVVAVGGTFEHLAVRAQRRPFAVCEPSASARCRGVLRADGLRRDRSHGLALALERA